MADEEQLKRFGEALERKKEDAKAASEKPRGEQPGSSAVSGDQGDLVEPGRDQDVRDERKKNTGKGKKTADKWNQ